MWVYLIMKKKFKETVFFIPTVLCMFLLSSVASSDEASKLEPPISAHYKKLNSDGTETNCIVTGNETSQERRNMQRTGCTLKTLEANNDIEIKVTLRTSSGLRSILMTSRYYLMWLNSGLHAVNIIRNLPFALTSIVTLRPIDSLLYLGYSLFYSVGLSQNANQTLYPFLERNFPYYFYSDDQNKLANENKDNNNGDDIDEDDFRVNHFMIIGADLIMWWLDAPIAGFDINKLMLGLDLLHLALDMAI